MATRRERVVLELEDHFSTGMARAAASAALLNRELNALSKDSVRTRRSFSDIDSGTVVLGRHASDAGSQIDKLSGRMRILADVATILGPALVPIGAVGVPAVAGLASQFGFAATAAGVTVLAFQGIGDAVKTMNTAALQPTTTNLEKARLALEDLSPAAQGFVSQLSEMRPALRALRDDAQEGLFPGLTAGLDSLEAAFPRVQAIISAVANELGDISADVGASLASDRWAPFLDFLATEAPEALGEMADAAGNVAHAMANLWIAFDPVNDDFSNWLVDATASLDEWTANLSQTQGFQDFVAYIQDTGPQVAETFAAIANAVLQIVEAAAPLGGPVLAGIEALAKAISTIADSDIGTPLFTAAAALALFNRTMAVTVASRNGLAGFGARLTGAGASMGTFNAKLAQTRTDLALLGTTALTAGARTQREMSRMSTAATRLRTNLAPIGRGAGLLGGLAVASTGVADGMGLANTASLALMGTIAGPWGAAVGGAAGLLLDAKAAGQGFADAMSNVDQVVASGTLTEIAAKLAQLQAVRDDLSNTSGVGDFFGDLITKGTKGGNFGSAADRVDTQIRKVQDAFDAATEAAAGSVPIVDAYGNVLNDVGDTAQSTGDQINSMVEAMRTQRQEALAAFDAQTRYRQALKDAQAQAAKSDAGIKGSSDEAIKNREAIEQLAAAWNNQSDAVKNNDAKFRAAKQAFIDTATAMGVPIEQAKRLAKRLLEIPEKKVIGVEFASVNALRAIERIKREMAQIPKRLRTDYYVNQINTFNKRAQADVDSEGRPLFASGGWTGPGSKYQPAGIVHADEFVFSKEATRGNVAYLEALHRQLRGYADGGLVRRYPTPNVSVSVAAGGQSIDYDRLARAMSAVRPLYGDVNLQGDGSFERHQRERLSALDGVRRG